MDDWEDHLAQWPKDRPLPTEEQMKEANKRLNAETKEAYQNGYSGDYGVSLEFTMGTYNREVWWHLFFPEEKYVMDSKAEWVLERDAKETPAFTLRGRGF